MSPKYKGFIKTLTINFNQRDYGQRDQISLFYFSRNQDCVSFCEHSQLPWGSDSFMVNSQPAKICEKSDITLNLQTDKLATTFHGYWKKGQDF